MSIIQKPDDVVLAEIGDRLRQARLRANLTRDELAERTGVSPYTIRNAETGKNISLATLIAMLRGLGEVHQLESLLADTGPSPVELVRRQGRTRQRASGGSKGRGSDWTW